MKRLLLILLILNMLISSSCNTINNVINKFKKNTTNTKTTQQTTTQTSNQNTNKQTQNNTVEQTQKIDIANEYSILRNDMELQRLNSVKMENEAKEKIRLNFVNSKRQNINSLIQSKKDYITKMYKNMEENANAEYKYKIEKIKSDAQNQKDKLNKSSQYSDDQSKLEEQLNKIEQDRIDKEAKAREELNNKLYNIKIQRDAELMNLKNKQAEIEKLLKDYENSIKNAKDLRDKNQTQYKTSINAKYDVQFNELKSKKVESAFKWKDLINKENQELVEMYLKEDKAYDETVMQQNQWLEDQISKYVSSLQ
ncbi:hypothetical protein ABG79_00988 [Caloramator mitchellensis]|uniref:Chromosome partition protein Smc n=1 Tax=Caloramator mitchellensis TaxID=908809 RepID=A0A0R3JUE4_CALMK|nr:hypothetical protein [Caloramator mitchellensis]KRQ87190.1 hypothetical protein ABG79_00988 [Caloramator mitchellensis]